MSEQARAILELVERSWGDLSAEDRDALTDWLSGATGADLYMLLRHARQRWRRPRRSSSQTLSAIREAADPATEKDD